MTPDMNILKIGTRGSPLALAQANHVKALIEEKSNHNIRCDIVTIKTSGDKFLASNLQDLGGKGLFTKEIEEALQNHSIDIAVHSMKDVPTYRQEALEIASILPREDARDAFISEKYNRFEDLPKGAHIGTASLRREAILKRHRPDLKISLLRGNVQTRMKKVCDGEFDATLLAQAGLNRLGQSHIPKETFSVSFFPPAPAQGAVGIEVHQDIKDSFRHILNQIHCLDTATAITAERAFLNALDGNCRTPLSAYATINGDHIHLSGQLLSEDGTYYTEASGRDKIDNAELLGAKLGHQVKQEFKGT